jgi:hypothetical protein
MNDEMTNLDQTDEEILNPTVSDDALEAAGGIWKEGIIWATVEMQIPFCLDPTSVIACPTNGCGLPRR